MSDQSKHPRYRSVARRRQMRAAAVAGATAAAVAVWAISAALGVELEVTPGDAEPQTVGVVAVVLTSLGASLAGWGLLALLERLTTRGRRIWTVVAVVALVGSMAGPLAGVTTAVVVSLAAMHLAVAAVLIPALARA